MMESKMSERADLTPEVRGRLVRDALSHCEVAVSQMIASDDAVIRGHIETAIAFLRILRDSR
jgi:hypothetical protein